MTIIKVFALGKFGVKIGFNPDKWLKFGPSINAGMFTKGEKYNVEVTGDKITAISSSEGTAPVQLAAPEKTHTRIAKDDAPTKYGKPLSSYELDQDIAIRRSGVIQAAVKAVSPLVTNTDILFEEAAKLAEKMLSWVNQK